MLTPTPTGARMIPRAALALGLAGLLPFAYGLATILSPALAEATIRTIGPRFAGQYVLIAYGTVILCFMSGVLWGFAAKGAERSWRLRCPSPPRSGRFSWSAAGPRRRWRRC